MSRIFVTRVVPGTALDELRAAGHEVDLWPGELPPPRAMLMEHLAEAEGALTMVTDRLDRELLAACAGLRIVANMAAGYDNIDPEEAAALGIWVTNTPGVLAETTADMAFALLMAVARQVVASDRDTRAGGWKTWSPTAFLGHDVHGATLGIIGLGEIGTAMARRGRGFDMRLLYASRTRNQRAEGAMGLEWRKLPELLAEADFVSIHTPLTADTRHLIGERELALMKPTAFLINTARGGVLDQGALAAALRGGQIAGAALDVTDPEPLPLEHPLFGFANVIITPHIASASEATRARMASMAARNIMAALAGERPPNALNRPGAR
ncbi:MAG: D-glycerate dehydrogenase [Chloroflexi bacterium]|nr:D-glycerate dehydrogenase [Chloroflexota bacterium]